MESFALMLKDAPRDREIINGIENSIKQLPMVRKTLTDYFDSSIEEKVKLKDIFFLEYKIILKELDDIERLSKGFRKKVPGNSAG